MFEVSKKHNNNIQSLLGKNKRNDLYFLYDLVQNLSKTKKVNYLELDNNENLSSALLQNIPDVVVHSISKHNNPYCKNINYKFYLGECNSTDIISILPNKFDIIFVTGLESYFDIWTTFLNYSSKLAENGYMIFDNYNDFTNKPLIKSGVDHVVNQLYNDYKVLGTVDRFFGCNEVDLKNFFIIQKKNKKNTGFNIPIAVNINTYRKDDNTKTSLEKTLDSVYNQNYKNFKIFLIGDDYSHESEIQEIIKKYPSELIYFENLSFSRERKYHTNKKTLWKYGGINSANYGIDLALENGFSYIAHLDHDDIWTTDHVSEIVKAIEITGADFICTRAMHTNNMALPLLFNTPEKYIQFYPIYNAIIHSSVCINFDKIPLRYRDLFLNTGRTDDQVLPADGDMWERCRKHILKNNLRSFCVNKVTVYHDTENI